MKLRFLAFAALLLAAQSSPSSQAAVFFSVNFAPPPLPVVYQPVCPVDGYLWNPGYWAYGPYGYYWVPGFWTAPPAVGLLWTPPWWGFSDGIYAFHRGYWGPRVGFYGGINYGYGYFGNGFYGGEWAGNVFRYNTAVTRVNTTIIKNVYVNKTVVRNQNGGGRTSFNGGAKGVKAVASAQEKSAAAQRRSFATSQQTSRQEKARENRDLRASVNKGRPKEAAINSVRGNETQPGKQKPATAAAGKPVNIQIAKPKVESTAKKQNAARNEAAVQKQEQARAVARQREETTRNAEKRQAEVRAREIRERQSSTARQRQDAIRNDERRNAEARTRGRETALARRRMAERSRRPEVVAPRDANSRGDNASDQRKRKKRNQDSDDRR